MGMQETSAIICLLQSRDLYEPLSRWYNFNKLFLISWFEVLVRKLGIKYGYLGSARHSHCRGQGFESPMLHQTDRIVKVTVLFLYPSQKRKLHAMVVWQQKFGTPFRKGEACLAGLPWWSESILLHPC